MCIILTYTKNVLLRFITQVAGLLDFLADLDHRNDVKYQKGERNDEVDNYDWRSDLKYEVVADYSNHKDHYDEENNEDEEEGLESCQKWVNLD